MSGMRMASLKSLLVVIITVGSVLATEVCTPGEYHLSPDDVCMRCKCGDDGQPTNECLPVLCTIELLICPEGQQWRIRPGTCCTQECVKQACEPNQPVMKGCQECECGEDGYISRCYDQPCGGPSCKDGQWTRYMPGACCDFECADSTACTPGEYYSSPENPCVECVCGQEGRINSEQCPEYMCNMPDCPVGTYIDYIPGTCCGASCLPIKGDHQE